MTPNIPLSSPDPSKPRILPPVKPPRIIIEHFDLSSYKIDQAHGYVEADCQHCGATIKGQKNVTSNFIQHMRRRHPDAYELFSKSSTQRAKRPRLLAPTPTKLPTPQTIPAPSVTPPIFASVQSVPILPLPSPIQHPLSEATVPTPPIRPSSSSHISTDPSNPSRSDMILETALISATYRGAERTPCDLAQTLSLKTSCQIYLKREDLQIAGSPVFRAAYNYLAAIPTARSGVLAAGGTALAVAAAANKHVKPCHVILPDSTPAALLKRLAKFDAKFDVVGGTVEECVARALVKATEMNRTYVDVAGPKLRPGCEDAVAGYATLALELLQQCPHADRVFMAGGNALLFSGLSAVLQRLGRGVKLIGVVLDARCDDAHIVGNRVAGNGGEMVQMTAQQSMQEDWVAFTEDVVRVGRAEMCAGVRAVFEDCDGRLLEPVGAMSVAGAVKYARMHKLSHERIVAVVETPLRSFERLGMITGWSWRADESECVLCVQGRSEGDVGGAKKGLNVFMHEVGGTVGGGVKLKSLRFRGKWPLLLGLACNETTTAAMHLANLMSLGYNATDVTRSELAENELWTWGEEDVEEREQEGDREGDVRWGLFRVEMAENGVVEFLAVERAELELRRVSFTDDESGVGRLIVAAKGTEIQLGNLEREMKEHAMSVRRLRGEISGLKVLGCEGGGGRNGSEAERGELGVSNGEVVVKTACEIVDVENSDRDVGTHVDGIGGGEEANVGEREGGEGGKGKEEGSGREEGERQGGGGGEGGRGDDGADKGAPTDGSIVFTEVVGGEAMVEGGDVEAVAVAVTEGETENGIAESGETEGGVEGEGGAEAEAEAEGRTEAEAEAEGGAEAEAEAEGGAEAEAEAETETMAEVTVGEVAMEVEAAGGDQEGVVDGVSGGEIVGHGDGVEVVEEVEVVGECEGGEVAEHGEVEQEEMEIGEGEEMISEGDQV